MNRLAESRTFDLDLKVLAALANPEEYDWTLPDEYETAVFTALEGGQGFGRSRQGLFAVAMTQPDPIRITLGGPDGYIVTRY